MLQELINFCLLEYNEVQSCKEYKGYQDQRHCSLGPRLNVKPSQNRCGKVRAPSGEILTTAQCETARASILLGNKTLNDSASKLYLRGESHFKKNPFFQN